jgi:histidinol-phosphatase (PHP family)
VIDLHIHTARSRHGTGTVSDCVAAAESAGVSTIAITEHLPLPEEVLRRVPTAAGYAMPEEELPAYVSEVRAAASSSSAVEVLLGIEVDALADGGAHARTLLGDTRFDVVLGSVHLIDDWPFDDPALTDGYAEWDIRRLWERYFEDLAAAALTRDYDVIAHPDLVKKFCHIPEGDLGPLYRPLADAFREAGVTVEVNTAGLRKPCEELYPAPGLLAELHRAGVPVTVGSDAHRPSDVGAGWAEAARAVRIAGYTSVRVHRSREPHDVEL